ncbi:Transmembrane protein [Melia azedarach]|uniref:Transmembrane protein n=1 Tax=Melia azedarach TaxID=155640 RepID=A0ACC1YIJ6_MELAZ|nr:Transmembrane protein [Melia azedarach]
MGLSASKRVKTSLSNASEFDSACDSAYNHCLSLSQHAFDGVLPYQLLTASDHIHHHLLSLPQPPPIILKWVPDPPTRSQVDSAFKTVTRFHRRNEDEKLDVIGSTRFKEWAVVLYADAVVGNAGKALLSRVPIGVAGIAGIGVVTRSGKELIGTAIGVYALGVATSIYLGLSG